MRRPRLSFGGRPWIVLAGVLASARAHAAPGEAAQHYERGLSLAERGAHAEAIAAFQRAHELSPHPSTLFNVAKLYAALGDPVRAVDFFERYLTEAEASISAARRAEVEQEISKQRARIAELVVHTDAPGATLTVDETVVGTTPLSAPVRVATGTHRIRAELDGHRPAAASVTVSGGERREIALHLGRLKRDSGGAPSGALRVHCAARGVRVEVDGRPVPAALLAAPLRVSSGRHRIAFRGSGVSGDSWVEVRPDTVTEAHCEVTQGGTSPVPWRTVGFVTAGVGLTAGGAALAHALWNGSRYDTWRAADEELKDGGLPPADQRQRQLDNNELARSIERANRVSIGLGAGGAALLLGGAALVLAHPSRSSPGTDSRGLWLAPGSIGWSSSW